VGRERHVVLVAREAHELNAALKREIEQNEPQIWQARASVELVHDLNNPLTVVIGYAALVAEEARVLAERDPESGRSLTMTSADDHLSGRCTFVPGNFILRAADRGGHVLREAPSPTAQPRSTIATGGPVWERPDAAPRGRWLPVRVVLPKGGSSVTATGWLRQLGPYQSRSN